MPMKRILVQLMARWAAALTAALLMTGAAAAQVTEGDNGYYYVVQKGDTLWGLSQRFSSAPWVWPELWQENSRIVANPHLIYPGQKLRLTRVIGPRGSGAPASPQPSLDGIGYEYSLINQVGFVRITPVTPHGTVLRALNTGLTMISQDDKVYVRPAQSPGITRGQLMTVYRTFDPVVQAGQLIGTQHLLCGVLEVLQVEPEYATARIVRSYRPIEPGDKLMPFERRSPWVATRPSVPGMDGVIFKSEEPLNVFAEFHIAFMDRGSRDGIQPGQIYSIYYRDKLDLGTPDAPRTAYAPVDCGEFLVLHVEDNTATGLVTDTDKELRAGIGVRTPPSAF